MRSNIEGVNLRVSSSPPKYYAVHCSVGLTRVSLFEQVLKHLLLTHTWLFFSCCRFVLLPNRFICCMLTVTGNGVSFGFLTLASHQCLPRHHEAWRIVALRQTVLCVHLSITSSFTRLGIERRPHDSLIDDAFACTSCRYVAVQLRTRA